MKNKRSVWTINTEPFPEAHFATFPPELIRPCIMAGSKKKDVILDPFFGAGTVGVVAKSLNRNFIGIDINQDYVNIAVKRLKTEVSKIGKQSIWLYEYSGERI